MSIVKVSGRRSLRQNARTSRQATARASRAPAKARARLARANNVLDLVQNVLGSVSFRGVTKLLVNEVRPSFVPVIPLSQPTKVGEYTQRVRGDYAPWEKGSGIMPVYVFKAHQKAPATWREDFNPSCYGSQPHDQIVWASILEMEAIGSVTSDRIIVLKDESIVRKAPKTVKVAGGKTVRQTKNMVKRSRGGGHSCKRIASVDRSTKRSRRDRASNKEANIRRNLRRNGKVARKPQPVEVVDLAAVRKARKAAKVKNLSKNHPMLWDCFMNPKSEYQANWAKQELIRFGMGA